jgi:hypothetical protein
MSEWTLRSAKCCILVKASYVVSYKVLAPALSLALAENMIKRPPHSQQPAEPVKRPNFFLVGAPKSGTTAMVNYLSCHPDIFMGIKEMHHFGRDLRFRPPFYRRSFKEYLAEFQHCNGQRRIGEGSVWYLLSSRAASEIRAFNPRAKIIIMLREPVEMLYSLYYQLRYLGEEHLRSFEQALAAEPQRRLGRNIRRQACFGQSLLYRQTVRYCSQVQRYFEAFGREQVQVIIYDDLATDPLSVHRNTLEFLDVDPTFRPAEFKVVNGNKSVRFPALRAVVKDPLLHSSFAPLRPWLPRRLLGRLRVLDRCLWSINTRFERRPPLDPGLRCQLKDEFAPEVERLSELLNRDLSFWRK